MDIPYKDVLRFPYLAYATGRNRELLNLWSMGRYDVYDYLTSIYPHFTSFRIRWCLLAFVEGLVLFAMVVRFIGGKTVNSTGTYIHIHHTYTHIHINTEDGRNIQGVGINNEDGKSGGIYVDGFLMFCCVLLSMQYKVCLCISLLVYYH